MRELCPSSALRQTFLSPMTGGPRAPGAAVSRVRRVGSVSWHFVSHIHHVLGQDQFGGSWANHTNRSKTVRNMNLSRIDNQVSDFSSRVRKRTSGKCAKKADRMIDFTRTLTGWKESRTPSTRPGGYPEAL